MCITDHYNDSACTFRLPKVHVISSPPRVKSAIDEGLPATAAPPAGRFSASHTLLPKSPAACPLLQRIAYELQVVQHTRRRGEILSRISEPRGDNCSSINFRGSFPGNISMLNSGLIRRWSPAPCNRVAVYKANCVRRPAILAPYLLICRDIPYAIFLLFS